MITIIALPCFALTILFWVVGSHQHLVSFPNRFNNTLVQVEAQVKDVPVRVMEVARLQAKEGEIHVRP